MNDIIIRNAEDRDQQAVLDMISHYVRTGFASFINKEPGPEYFTGLKKMTRDHAFIVAEKKGLAIGMAILSAWRNGKLFEHTAKYGIFLAPEHTGRGLGELLLNEVENRARKLGVKSIVATIGSPNEPSLKFHRKHGFVEKGRIEMSGRKFDTYFDEVIVQKML